MHILCILFWNPQPHFLDHDMQCLRPLPVQLCRSLCGVIYLFSFLPIYFFTWNQWYIMANTLKMLTGAGIAQWLEHRTRDWKVAGSNPCWNGGRIFFSRVDFLCWLLFRYPFHPRVTTVARKKSRSFCQKCRWQVTAKHAYTLHMWILLNVLRHWSQLVPNMSNDIWGH